MGKGEHAYGPLYLIHSDVCGPLSINARGGFIYFITFIDDHSRFGYLYLMRYKSESFEKSINRNKSTNLIQRLLFMLMK